jgi:hypothetical protein
MELGYLFRILCLRVAPSNPFMKGVPSTQNYPGVRSHVSYFFDGELLWMFGGFGVDATGK